LYAIFPNHNVTFFWDGLDWTAKGFAVRLRGCQ